MTDDTTEPTALRAWVRAQADDLGVDVSDLLIQSKRRDPMWKGTDADRAKAEWFAEWWERATESIGTDRLHVRGLHYYMASAGEDIEPPTNCSWDLYKNTSRCYDYLEECSMLARILGTIPLGGIEDQKHDQMTVTTYSDHRRTADTQEVSPPAGIDAPGVPKPEERASLGFDPRSIGGETPLQNVEFDDATDYALLVAESVVDDIEDDLYLDAPRQAPYHLELWSEKTLPEYIHDLARSLGVNVIVEGQGDLSLTIAHDLVRRIDDAGKPAVILYLSDFDAKGDHMSTAMSGKLAWLNERGDVDHRVAIEQLALTKEQVEQLDLPRKPIEESSHTGTGGRAYDTLVDDWERRKGKGATELNALEARPEEFERIVREGVERYIDPDIPAKNAEAREEWREQTVATIRDAIRNAGLDEQIGAVVSWATRYNEALDEAEPVLRELREFRNDPDLADWVRSTRDAVDETALPLVEVPEGHAPWPEDPLFDTDREYVQNVARIQQHANDR
ncbi:hypothetical protein [Haloferax sulfurifontis]|uniref:Uncharacterized protein n=2 Tax=Haloferax sulfurifontis TaxID=255616 RepID=M0IKM7_9EURY|nr:hypothetical protein [Haloferax sulfurifontis]ELZ96577.1 hypothetical protein C441_04394 [Haloferax sulfurifontis ATCC BAA-897]GGC72719.1 hypothetical protein GCM10007209_38370 [Haloferax sulfurifontis]